MYAKMIEGAIQAHARLEIDLPTVPPHYSVSGRKEFRRVLERVGFNGASMIFKLHTIRWNVPSAAVHSMRNETPACASPDCSRGRHPKNWGAIQLAIEESVCRYAEGDSFSTPKAAYVVAVSKK
jgi:hypothetical protein